MIGQTLGGYRIETLAGKGGMGEVYRALDVRLDRHVALKALGQRFAEDEQFRERFLRESRLAASLDHPNVIPVYEAGEADGRLFIAMRFVEGTDLRRLLAEQPVLEPARALALLAPVAGALDTAHRKGLVHRDVKPGNILIAAEPKADPPEHVYLTDFGLTTLSSDPGGDGGPFSGTADYSAPELVGGPVSGRADVYALGCVLYECLTGGPPFKGASVMSVLWRHANDPVPSASEANPDLPTAIDRVLERALAKEPEERYPTCRELVDDARDSLGLPVALRLSRRQFVLAAGGTAVAVAAAVAAPLALTRGGGKAAAVALPLKEHSLVRVEPATGRLLAATPLGADPGRAAAGAAAIWVTSPDEAKLLRIEPESGRVTNRIDVSRVGWPILAAGNRFVWFAYPVNEVHTVVYRYDPRGRSLRSFPTEVPPQSLVTAGGAIWIGCEEVARMLESGRVAKKVKVPANVLAVGEGAVWATGETGVLTGQGKIQLREFDPITASVRSETELEAGVSNLAAGLGAIWVVRLTDDSITRVDAKTRASTEGFHVRLPELVATGDGAVWVTSARDGTLTRYDATTADLQTIDVGGTPTGMAVTRKTVWVAVKAA